MAGSPTRRSHRRTTVIGATALASMLVAAGCGNGEDAEEPEAPEVEADEELAAMVPDEFREAEEFVVGVNAEYPPGEFLDDDQETIVGFNVDLFDAVADKLDLDVRWENAPFDNIIIGVDSGEYDAGVSSFTINEDRLEQVNMVSYFTVGTQWFTRSGNPDDVDPDNACGLNIAVETATVQVEDLEARSEECVEAGEEEISIEEFPSQENANETVVSGVNHAGLADMPVVAYAVELTDGQLETLGEQYEAAPYGAVVHEDQDELAEAIRAGYEAIIEDGVYDEVLDEWDVTEGAITEPQVNPDLDE
ncbi:ABC transporter substrate-binding protein [Lipingzhangella sp. LS1_29]|uniref:ABC transporter substrate-binding protein n=1 Tax=Lipingzhangella rawalii TaxID=2055835 RepID=A0ABU2H9W0_9ACTN|nr:ABC transporter substrate-binding protein [Lipingzhangella rawalii]MDS1272056.1 ABC transporter substrate-binding protein [Lipingzhangella rawalii]